MTVAPVHGVVRKIGRGGTLSPVEGSLRLTNRRIARTEEEDMGKPEATYHPDDLADATLDSGDRLRRLALRKYSKDPDHPSCVSCPETAWVCLTLSHLSVDETEPES